MIRLSFKLLVACLLSSCLAPIEVMGRGDGPGAVYREAEDGRWVEVLGDPVVASHLRGMWNIQVYDSDARYMFMFRGEEVSSAVIARKGDVVADRSLWLDEGRTDAGVGDCDAVLGVVSVHCSVPVMQGGQGDCPLVAAGACSAHLLLEDGSEQFIACEVAESGVVVVRDLDLIVAKRARYLEMRLEASGRGWRGRFPIGRWVGCIAYVAASCPVGLVIDWREM